MRAAGEAGGERCSDPALKLCACSSMAERCPDKTEVDGSIPSMRKA